MNAVDIMATLQVRESNCGFVYRLVLHRDSY